jgi:hypothetical protein
MADSKKKPAAKKAAAKPAAGKAAGRKGAAPLTPRRQAPSSPAVEAQAKPAATRAAARRPAAGKAAAEATVEPKPAAKRATARKPSAAKPAAKEAAAAKPVAKKAAAAKPAVKKAAAAKPVAKKAAAAKPAVKKSAAPAPAAPPTPDPEGFFVARVRGEDAVRDAPHPMLESGGFDEEAGALPAYDEGLGDLPWAYGDDALVALPRDPRTLFLYWDHARATLEAAFAGVEQPHAQIWLFALGAGWERVRVIDFALESRGYYVHDLEPGRVYRAEVHVVGRGGQDRLLPAASNPVVLPPVGPSPVIDDRFVQIPWELPLPRLLGPGAPGGPFSEELRALLARLSDWARFQAERAGAPGAGGMGGRPTSPPGGPDSPSSPFGSWGGRDA